MEQVKVLGSDLSFRDRFKFFEQVKVFGAGLSLRCILKFKEQVNVLEVVKVLEAG